MDAQQILAFRLARVGLADRDGRTLAEAAACPASDFARDAALLALAARADDVSRDGFAQAVDGGEIVVAHVIRGAIHAIAPGDHALYGRALLASDDAELATQLGEQVRREAKQHGFGLGDALDEVAGAVGDALRGGRKLDKVQLHEEMRQRVGEDLLPYCRGCKSRHVAPMLWRYATVKAGARLDSERRYVAGKPGRAPAAHEAVRRFLGFYGPAKPAGFAEWAGLAKSHAQRLWAEIEGDLAEADGGWLLAGDVAELESPPAASGVRFLPAGDPYLQKPNRPLLAPDNELRKRIFRPVASPGAVLKDGRLVGLWRAKAGRGRATEVAVEKLGRVARQDLADEAERVVRVRGGGDLALTVE